MEKVSIFGVNIDNVNMEEAKYEVKKFLESDRLNVIFTPNTEIVMAAKDDENIRQIVNSADLVIADGIGLIYGSKIQKKPLKERVTGFDISMEMLKMANENSLSLYLLGAKPGYALKAKENINNKYPNINVVGVHNGYFKGIHTGVKDSDEEKEIIEEINKLNPDIIFVGFGFPKQELWINEYKNKLNSRVIIGNGGVIDILSGNAQRAPEIWQKLGLEWFYRLLQDPRRIKRQMVLPKFMIKVIFDKEAVK